VNAGAATLALPERAARGPSQAEGVAVLGAVLLLPCVAYALDLAATLRLAYPLLNFAVSGWLFARRSPWFAAHGVLLFCFVSLVRRLVDGQAGFDPASPVLVTPYLCSLFTAVGLLQYWWRPQPRYLAGFLLVLLAIGYGAMLAVLQGNVVAAGVDFLKWGAGPMLAVYLLAHRHDARVRELAELSLIWAGMAMGVYGVLQFVSPASWDAIWVRGVAELGLESIGSPEPFALRVFSTMNSPGSLGGALSAGILLACKRTRALALPAITLMLVGLALTQYRTLWAATALGALMLLVTRPNAFRPANLAAAAVALAALGSFFLVPQIRDTLAQRAASLGNLRADFSGEERLAQYRALTRDEGLIVGEGLGQIGVARRLGGMSRVIMDSALIEIWRGLGAIAGSMYLGSLLVMVLNLFQRAPEVAHHLHFDRAVVLATFIQLPMGSVHSGENGIFAWMFLGLGLGTLAARGETT
jgi:hypothetical protein